MKVKDFDNVNHEILVNERFIKTILQKGQYGCYFEPISRWVSLEWLINNNFEDIAIRISELIQSNDRQLRYCLRYKKNTQLSCSENDKNHFVLSYFSVEDLEKILAKSN